jgi:hypothetical protein
VGPWLVLPRIQATLMVKAVKWERLLAGLFLLSSCSLNEDTQKPGALQYGSGTNAVSECATLGSGSQKCDWTFLYDPDACAGEKCSKLVIYFSGGQMSCPDPKDPSSYLAQYASLGYVAVCARLYEDSTGSSQFPYSQEASRVNLLVRAIAGSSTIRRYWDGKYLLHSGVSHGATAPVVAMARGNYDEDPSWKGSVVTAACFLDGTYDVPALFGFLRGNSCAPAVSVLSYERAYSRYCSWSGGILPVTWPSAASCNTAATQADSLGGLNVTSLSIPHWKLVECGSSLGPCLQDVLPGSSIQSLCATIDGSSEHTCSFESHPSISHVGCGIETSLIQSCDGWFKSLLK